VLSATLVEMASPRYTPAGIPAIDVQLLHASQQDDSGQSRQVTLQLRGIAFGAQADRLVRTPLGAELQFQGFLTNGRNGKGVVFHIQDFKPI